MKKTTKALALALCAVLLVVGTALTTIAYLQDDDSVINTFTVGKIDMKLDEADVDEYGKEIAGADRVKTNEYKLVPACTYIKDPTTYIKNGSEPCYVRMIVTISDIADVKAAFGTGDGGYFYPQNFVSGWNNDIWQSISINEVGDTAEYTFYYKEIVDVSEVTTEGYEDLEPLFTSFTVPKTVTEEQLLKLDNFKIDVKAHAIQSAGFADAAAAWAQFVEPTTTTTPATPEGE